MLKRCASGRRSRCASGRRRQCTDCAGCPAGSPANFTVQFTGIILCSPYTSLDLYLNADINPALAFTLAATTTPFGLCDAGGTPAAARCLWVYVATSPLIASIVLGFDVLGRWQLAVINTGHYPGGQATTGAFCALKIQADFCSIGGVMTNTLTCASGALAHAGTATVTPGP